MVFYPYSLRRADAFPTAIDIRVAGDPDSAVAGVRDALTRAEPELTFNVTSMPMRLAQHIERDRAVAYLTSAFAGLRCCSRQSGCTACSPISSDSGLVKSECAWRSGRSARM